MKRFIAGAQCPKCKNIDTLYLSRQTENNVVACTRCDYSELRSTSVQHADNEKPDDKNEQLVTWGTSE